MTLPTYITVFRLLLIPVFVTAAILYSQSVTSGTPQENLRWLAVGVFVLASLSDALDGFLARKLNQFSKLGAFLDPLADKCLLLFALTTLAVFPWGPAGWQLPPWFIILVVARDIVIVGGLWILHQQKTAVKIHPHWTGKVCTVTQMFALGWVMLKWVPFSPLYPALLASLFTLWSGVAYFRLGLTLLQEKNSVPR
ncbi:CDP-diacylglycerol--glycerol-3-phosphate 3-phosphatidyltransferase [Roseibacillus ishigakijimensis]|uniref:CDP-diacylglycerol--glycerol-3-phosphate 3-phosphatidyltransferase n=1 Tax=Roseibacillus ishigakijimensis TaxID=454146 RepID=A0A934RMR2_9BACT|nr:CDP-diacylglycerol--glycerol-3-phosphate 3-phosphatidyltransferase [Roseibacillus ishigakijimensis]MBK1834652.1 CDP-diacylglycerol--glycerol-3-phosphate 3-phosphatidyltransferase [Roseibacillus ishigakijimensis]